MSKRTQTSPAKRGRGAAAPRSAASRDATRQPGRRPASSRAERAASRRAGRTASPRAGRPHASPAKSAGSRATRAAEQTCALALPPECTLAGAEDLKLKLVMLSKSVKAVTVDVSGVRRIDSASLQLLAAFARDRGVRGLTLELSGESSAFAEGVRLLGLTRLLGAVPIPDSRGQHP